MSQGGSIRVDPAGLEDLAGRIEQVASHLRVVKATFDGQEAVLQSDLIESALHDFNAAWSDKRGALQDGLDAAAGVLRNAAEQFRTGDAGLAGAISGAVQEAGKEAQ